MVGECFQTYFVLAFADTPVLFRLLQGTVGKFAFQLCFVQIVGGLLALYSESEAIG